MLQRFILISLFVVCWATFGTSLKCYECTGFNEPCGERVNGTGPNVTSVECEGYCASQRMAVAGMTGVYQFVRACRTGARNPSVSEGCNMRTGPNSVDQCICSTDFCNVQSNWTSATTSTTTIKCYYCESGSASTQCSEPFDKNSAATMSCSVGSCYDRTTTVNAEGKITARGCRFTVANGCTDGPSSNIRTCDCTKDLCNGVNGVSKVFVAWTVLAISLLLCMSV